jgi:spore germination protein YaaH
VLDQLEAEGVSDKASGLVIDFEDLPPGAQPDLLTFLSSARGRCRRHGWTLAITAPVADPNWNLSALAKSADRVILMAYDEHWQSGAPGPIASNPWFDSVVKRAVAQLPPAEAIVAVASYAYDWPVGEPATILSIPRAETLAAENGVRPERDPRSGSEHFTYTAGGVAHVVWMSDTSAVRGQMEIARSVGARVVGLWRLGTEDPAIWDSWGADDTQ